MLPILRVFPWLIGLVFFLPIIAGLVGTLLFSLGYLPGASHHITWQGWHLLFTHPSLWQSTILTLFIGLSATFFSVAGAIFALMYLDSLRLLHRCLFLLLSFPHFAVAVGMIFLLAPTGWLVRAVGLLFSFDAEPLSVDLVRDAHGMSLILMLVIKETPFLLCIAILHLVQIQRDKQLSLIRSLGYSQESGFMKVILPQLLPKLRLPIFSVLVYSLSNIELSIAMAPNIPKPLILLFHYWFLDTQEVFQYAANAGALYLLMISATCLMLWVFIEKMVIRMCVFSALKGQRESLIKYFKKIIHVYLYGILLLVLLCVIVLIIWIFAKQWFFPDFLPSAFTLKNISRYSDQLFPSLVNTFSIGVVSTTVALLFVIGALEYESRKQQYQRSYHYFQNPQWLWMVYMPLIIPTISFILGIYVFFLYMNLTYTWLGLFWVHLLFILPYVFLSLTGNYLSFNAHYYVQARLLCRSDWKSFFCIKLPMLMRVIALAFAIGFSVSVAQYITTLYIGGGRITTVSTETLASLSGSNRRVIAIYTLYQWILPLGFFFMAFFLSPYRASRSQ